MLISIIIPTRNRYKMLEKCLRALKDGLAGFNNWEVIVSDDFSSENNSTINSLLCRKYGYKYLHGESNLGPAAARNRGLRVSTGKWVSFIDDDIVINQGWYETLVSITSKSNSTVCGIEGRVIASGRGLWDSEVSNSRGGLYLTSNITYRKEVLDSVNGFDEGFKGPHGEDQELALRVLKKGEVPFYKELSVTHLPREINPLRHIITAPSRIKTYIDCEYHFYIKHKNEYADFRYHSTFWGTYGSLLFTHTLRNLRKRKQARLLENLLYLPVLILSSLVESAAAWLFLPGLIGRSVSGRENIKPAEAGSERKAAANVWFAANISSNEWGGVYRSFNELAKGLKDRGYKTKIVYSPRFAGNNYLVFSLYLLLRLMISRSDKPGWLISRSSDGVFCALFSRAGLINVRTVLYNHGWEENVYRYEQRTPRYLVSYPTTWKARLLRFPLIRLHLHLSDYCVCGTLHESGLLKRKYQKFSSKVKYIPNGVTVPKNPFWGSQKDMPMHFMAVGGFTWKKNMDYTVKLFLKLKKDIPSASLFLAGTGKPAADCLREIDMGKYAIKIIESVKPSEMKGFYRKCPFLISSSRYEGGHSFALLEAMAEGIVVFATKIFSTAEFVIDKRNGLFISGDDIKEDCRIIKRSVFDRQKLLSIRTRAHSTAKRNSWQRQVMRLEKLL